MHGEVNDRIKRLDPFADAVYAHPDQSAMLDRITERATPRRPRRRAAVLAPLGATLAAGLVAVGLLAAPATTALAPAALEVPIPHAHGVQGFAVETQGSHLTTTTCRGCDATAGAPTAYVVAAPLATSAPSVDAFRAVAPADPAATLGAAARYLGVRATVARTGDAWRATGPEGGAVATATLSRDAGTGLYVFRYRIASRRTAAECGLPSKANAPSGASVPSVTVDPAGDGAALRGLLGALGDRYAVSDPRFGASFITGSRCAWVVTLGEQVVVGGVPTDQSVSLALTPSGRVVGATVPVFGVGPATPVALVSPAAAAASLERATTRTLRFGTGSPLSEAYRPEADQSPAYGAFGGRLPRALSGAVGEVPLRVVPRGLLTVELKAATVGLRAFATAQGTWLLPVYDLSGDGYATAVRSTPTPWSGQVLATSRASVHLRGAPTNQSLVFGAQPLRP